MKIKITALAVGICAAVMLTGCAPTAPNASPALSSPPKASPKPSSSPSPTPSAVTCDSIVTPAALLKLTSDGREANPDFEAKVRAEGGALVRLLDFGGVVCQWGIPGTDATAVIGFAYVTAAQADQECAALSASGWVASKQADGSELWAPPSLDNYLGNVPAYQFRDGSVRYALDAKSSFGDFAV